MKRGLLGKRIAMPDMRVALLKDRMPVPLIPDTAAWHQAVRQYPMLHNDQCGDCTCAAVYHMMQTWEANSGGSSWLPTDQQALALYSIVGGWPAMDNGALESEVLGWWVEHGMPFDPAKAAVQMAYCRLGPHDLDWLRYAIATFGGAYVGLALPRTAQAQCDVGGAWDVVSTASQRMIAAGSWGGHAVNLTGYDKSGFWCVTWGELQYITDAFMAAYCDEAYALISSDWLNARNVTPTGLDMGALMRDMDLIKGVTP